MRRHLAALATVLVALMAVPAVSNAADTTPPSVPGGVSVLPGNGTMKVS